MAIRSQSTRLDISASHADYAWPDHHPPPLPAPLRIDAFPDRDHHGSAEPSRISIGKLHWQSAQAGPCLGVPFDVTETTWLLEYETRSRWPAPNASGVT